MTSGEELHEVRLTVNGAARRAQVPARRLLSDFIRHDLQLTGTHVGCEHGVCGACPVLLAGAPGAQGLGSYFNVESPQVKPLAVARVGVAGTPHDYLLVCNTPDNCVEVYDTHDRAFLGRVPTGLEPISVVWNAANQHMYVTSFLGDSITVATLPVVGSTVRPTFLRTVNVGDEPM